MEVSKLTYRLEKSSFQTAKENQLVITKKNDKPNQKLTEIVVGAGVSSMIFYENAKMVSKSLNKVTP